MKKKCLTPGAVWHISIGPDRISVIVDIPDARGDVAKGDAIELEKDLHDCVENVLSRLWRSENKELISECQKLWTNYYKHPTIKNLTLVFEHLEIMKLSKDNKVQSERSKCLKTANNEIKKYE